MKGKNDYSKFYRCTTKTIIKVNNFAHIKWPLHVKDLYKVQEINGNWNIGSILHG